VVNPNLTAPIGNTGFLSRSRRRSGHRAPRGPTRAAIDLIAREITAVGGVIGFGHRGRWLDSVLYVVWITRWQRDRFSARRTAEGIQGRANDVRDLDNSLRIGQPRAFFAHVALLDVRQHIEHPTSGLLFIVTAIRITSPEPPPATRWIELVHVVVIL